MSAQIRRIDLTRDYDAHRQELKLRAVGLGAVLRHKEPVPVRHLPGPRVVEGLSVQMDPQYAPGPVPPRVDGQAAGDREAL